MQLTMLLSASDRNSVNIGIYFYLQYLQHKVIKNKRPSGSFIWICLDSPRVYSTGYRRRPPQHVSLLFTHSNWRLNFLPGLTAALTGKRLTALTSTWPHYYGYVSCSHRTYATLKSIRSSPSSSSSGLPREAAAHNGLAWGAARSYSYH